MSFNVTVEEGNLVYLRTVIVTAAVHRGLSLELRELALTNPSL